MGNDSLIRAMRQTRSDVIVANWHALSAAQREMQDAGEQVWLYHYPPTGGIASVRGPRIVQWAEANRHHDRRWWIPIGGRHRIAMGPILTIGYLMSCEPDEENQRRGYHHADHRNDE